MNGGVMSFGMFCFQVDDPFAGDLRRCGLAFRVDDPFADD